VSRLRREKELSFTVVNEGVSLSDTSSGSLSPNRLRTFLAAALLVALIVVVAFQYGWIPDFTEGDEERAQVVFTDDNGDTLASITARIADTPSERYQGLSGTEDLPDGTGMLFVFERGAQRTFVMRGMNYPLDMIFVGADGHITTIHHAPLPSQTPEGGLIGYPGSAKWVVEVPFGYTSNHGISVGDRVSINYGD
jgi:hypothetical protein